MGSSGETLRDVEVLRTGTFQAMDGPVTYTDPDLEAIVAAFGLVGFKPALKVDVGAGRPAHSEGGPAYGWIVGVRKAGDLLLADFEVIDPTIAEMIRSSQYDRVSAEVIPDFKRNGTIFPFVLGAVELLGVTIPAVPDLKPVSESVGLTGGSRGRITTMAIGSPDAPRNPTMAIHKAVQQKMVATGRSYASCYDAVLLGNPELRHASVATVMTGGKSSVQTRAGLKIHELTVARQEAKDLKYQDALAQILAEHPKLKSKYAGGGRFDPTF